MRIAFIASATVALSLSSAQASAEESRNADEFVDSLGVNIHLNFGDTLYGKFDEVVKPKLVALGVRHVRDGAITGSGVDASHLFYQRARILAKSGIRFSLITAMDTSFGSATDYTQLHDVVSWCDGAVDQFEGINEPDLQTIPGKPAGAWVTITHDAQKTLFDTIRGDASLALVRVAGPSITSLNDALDKAGDLSAFVDYGNGHPYPGGFCPACGTFYGQSVDTFAPLEAKVFSTKPMVMTETGYSNDVKAVAGGNRPVSEIASGRYLPRLLFEFFNRKIVRTYPYELLDEKADPSLTNVEEHFGIVANDGSEKPAFVAEKNLIALLADPGPSFASRALDLTITAPKEVHHTLLQKRDGTYFLVLWNEVASYDTGWRAGPPSSEDTTLRKDLAPPPVTVDVSVSGSYEVVRLHAFGDDGTLTNKALVLTAGHTSFAVRDALSILELGNLPVTSDGGIADGAAADAKGDSDVPTGSLDGDVEDTTDASEKTDASDASDAANGDPGNASGCGCRTAPESQSGAFAVGSLSLAAVAIASARRRARRSTASA